MKVEYKKTVKQMRKLPDVARGHLVKAVRLNTEEGARVARTLSYYATGETADKITTEYTNGGLTGTVVVIASGASRAEKDEAYSIEYGRKRGDRGTTEGGHAIWRTRQFLEKKFKGRIKRAMRKAVKEVSNG